jgi:ATP-dependent helicase/nuclease subunit A
MVEFEDLTDQQQAAADALDRNVTLTAGAGTGKTTTLAARYMRMLERGMADDAPADPDAPLLPEEIVTTTFTERAANELKESVREAITERVADASPGEYAAWREVADGLENGYIHTLHGFCSRLLREHALDVTAVDPGFDTLDETETTALLEETVATLLETHDDHEAVERLARLYSRDSLRSILTDLLTERPGGIEWAERWADATEAEYLEYVDRHLHPVPPETAAERLGDPAVREALATLGELIEDPPAAVDTGGQAWGHAADAVGCLDDDSDRLDEPTVETRDLFLGLCDALTKNGGDRYASYTGAKSNWDDSEAKALFDDAITTVVGALEPEAHVVDADPRVEANSVPFVQALARLTILAHEAYTERKREQNVVDFTDQVELALEFLTEEATGTQLADLRERFAYVMIDEFQDTDPRQWELIKYLTAPDPDAFDARNVFVVGDVKQSIYRFRNADVTQFHRTAGELETANPADATAAGSGEGEDDQLSTNFRSLPGVLAPINELFDAVFEEDGAPYEAAPQRLDPFRDDPADLASVAYLAVPTDPDYRARRFPEGSPFATLQPADDAELEARALAARLTQLFDGPAQVYEEGNPEDPEAVALDPEDVAILLRSRTRLKEYERALEAADVPFTVASGLGFYETPEVTTLLNLFRVLADPSDERALYGVLRSPLFGCTDDTLAMLKRDGASLWATLGEADGPELRDAHDLLSDWREALGVGPDADPRVDGSWAAFLTRVIEETGYLVSVSADERPQQAVANVEKFREELRGYSDDGVTSLPTLVRRIERRRDLESREGEATVAGGGEGVSILTVHDAKGMEFPVVVVPDIGRGFNMRAAVGERQVEFETVDGAHAAGLKVPAPTDPLETETTIARETLKQRRKAEERAEQKRVLYVACTRARDRLLLTGLHDLDDGGSLADIEDADPEEATSWRDWLQPELLDEATRGALEATDSVTGSIGDADVTVRLPTPAVDWREGSDPPELALDQSPAPPRPERQFRLSPTDLAALVDDEGSLRLDERTNTVLFEGEDDEGYDDDGDGGPRALPSTAFGEAVHRLCELRPPEDRRESVIEQVLEEKDVDTELTATSREAIGRHAERGSRYVDRLHADADVRATYDELYVTTEFETGEISGYIDHLVVTPDAYHVVDYKTNYVTVAEVPEKAEYYKTQMEAYAIALHQQHPSRAVRAALYFTEPGEACEFEWNVAELEALRERTEQEVCRAMPAEDV